MNNQKYKDDIQFLIDALGEFKTKESIDTKVFDGLLGAEIQDTIFGIIREHNIADHPNYKNFSKVEFEKLSIEEEIEALEKVIALISTDLNAKVPDNLQEMLTIFNEEVEKVKNIPVEQRRRIPIDQTFEARFRRAFEYSRRQQEINGLITDDEVLTIAAVRANEVKAVAKENPKEFTEELAKAIVAKTNAKQTTANEAARIYTEEYFGKSAPDQNVATLNPNKIVATAASKKPTALYQILNTGGEVAKAAEAVILVGAIGSQAGSKQLVEEIKRNPEVFQEKLATQILAQVMEPTTARRIEVERNVREIAANYTQSVIAGINPVIDANLIKAQIEAGNTNIELPQVTREVNDGISGNMSNIQEVIQSAATKPQEMKEQIKESVLGEKSLTPQEDKIFNDAVDTYIDKLAGANGETEIMTATAQAAVALETITGETQTEKILNAVQPQIAKTEIAYETFGENAELVELVVQAKTIEQEGEVVIPVIPVVTDEKTIGILNERFTTNATETPVLNMGEEAAASGFLATPLGQFYLDMGEAKIAEKEPEKAIAIRLKRNGVNLSNFHFIERLAIQNNVSQDQLHVLKSEIEKLNTAAKEGTLNWSNYMASGKFDIALQRANITPEVGNLLFAGGTLNYQAIAPQHNFLGGAVFKIGQQVFGGRAEKLIKGSINKGLQKAAIRAGGAILEKVAATGIGKAIGGVAVALGIVGSGGATALIAGGKWLWDKAKFIIHNRSGQILGVIGGLIGGLIAGPVGLLVGIGIGAQIAGIDWKKWGRITRRVLAVIGAYFLARLILPLIIAGSILIGGTLFVSLVLFIINSGAYVVPTGAGAQFGSVPGGKIQCFVLTGFDQKNLDIEKQVIEKMSVATGYMSQLCKDGDITVKYESVQAYSDNGKPYGGFVTDGGTIIHIYNIGLLSVSNAFYTLTHETGHVFDHRYPDVKSAFRDDPQVHAEGFVCTYPFGSSLTEDFAESVAGYFSANPVSVYRDFSCMKGQSFQSKYPGHWQFMNEKLFGGQVVQ